MNFRNGNDLLPRAQEFPAATLGVDGLYAKGRLLVHPLSGDEQVHLTGPTALLDRLVNDAERAATLGPCGRFNIAGDNDTFAGRAAGATWNGSATKQVERGEGDRSISRLPSLDPAAANGLDGSPSPATGAGAFGRRAQRVLRRAPRSGWRLSGWPRLSRFPMGASSRCMSLHQTDRVRQGREAVGVALRHRAGTGEPAIAKGVDYLDAVRSNLPEPGVAPDSGVVPIDWAVTPGPRHLAHGNHDRACFARLRRTRPDNGQHRVTLPSAMANDKPSRW